MLNTLDIVYKGILMRIKYTKAEIEEFIKQSRGRGELALYKPWILTRELIGAPSRKVRVRSLLTGRVCHLLSDLKKRNILN